MNIRAINVGFGLLCVALCSACADDGKNGAACSVAEQSDGSVTIACADGSTSTLVPPRPVDGGVAGSACSVERDANVVTIRCPDGSSVTLDAAAADAGTGTGGVCSVTQASDGSIDIVCPDGSHATLPGTKVVAAGAKVGAATASCGTCHDSDQAKAHFTVMTVQLDAGPQETCGTCHRETSLEPVSRVHSRLELGLPGLKVQMISSEIDTVTRKARVRLQLSDGAGAPLARTGVSFSFTLAKVNTISNAAGTAQLAGPYQSYLNRTVTQLDSAAYPLGTNTPRTVQQPTTEAGTGTFTAVSDGVYDYTFFYTLPVGYDATASHVVGLYATRTLDGVRFVANAERFFVPNDANATPRMRDAVKTETCNNCHNPLSAHGGARQDVQLCLTCHSQGALDPESGNSLDLNVMIHRIHRGKNLPSVRAGTPYSIVGRGLSTADFSRVGYPQPIENCQSCHTKSDGDRWITNGTRTACTSCHDNIDKAPAAGGHPFQLNADATCGTAACHAPGGNVPDAFEAHKTFLNLDTASVFELEILSVSVVTADSAPAVRIRARTGTRATGAILPVTSVDNLSLLSVFINGPNSGYGLSGNTIVPITKAELAALTMDATHPGEFTFALPKTLRETVGSLGDPELDSYTLSLRGAYDPTPGIAPDNDRTDMLKNPAAAFTASEELLVRRPVVETAKCNSCHGDLRGHGGGILAKNVEQCVMCHTGTLDTRVRQGANKVAGATTSLRFSTLVHRIHGKGVAKLPYYAYGFSAAAPFPKLDFSAVPFPGDVRDCASCHAAGTYFLPLPEGDPPTQTAILDAEGKVTGP